MESGSGDDDRNVAGFPIGLDAATKFDGHGMVGAQIDDGYIGLAGPDEFGSGLEGRRLEGGESPCRETVSHRRLRGALFIQMDYCEFGKA